MMPWPLAGAAAGPAGNPLLQGLAAALGTLVLEDPTTVACGLLVAEGHMAFATAFLGLAAGIAVGDVALFGIGRALGPTVLARGWVAPARFERARGWFRQNLVLAVVLSRFVPGMRLPTYVAAGAMRAPVWRFIGVAVMASLAWTALLLYLTHVAGRALLPALGSARWPVAALAIAALVLLQRRAGRALEADATPRVTSRFEFWPMWLFYPPVALYCLGLALRHRGLTLPTAANPSIPFGGLIGESKSAILDLVPERLRPWVAAYTTFERERAEPRALLAAAERALAAAGLSYPIVAKPDLGQRGAGVRPVCSAEELQAYLAGFPAGARVVLQRLVSGPSTLGDFGEAGVLYWRLPGATHGRIASITLKRPAEAIGDGRRTLGELIADDPRARRLSAIYCRRLAPQLGHVLALGERMPLVFAGNHCQGALFRDGTGLATPALERRIDEIASAIPEFHFGRFDVRFDDLERFLAGEAFTILEINGAGAEATHIWDPSMRLHQAYATLFEQFRVLYAIGAANRRRGFRPSRLGAVVRAAWSYRRLARSYPATA